MMSMMGTSRPAYNLGHEFVKPPLRGHRCFLFPRGTDDDISLFFTVELCLSEEGVVLNIVSLTPFRTMFCRSLITQPVTSPAFELLSN